jgi:hypothetical protein
MGARAWRLKGRGRDREGAFNFLLDAKCSSKCSNTPRIMGGSGLTHWSHLPQVLSDIFHRLLPALCLPWDTAGLSGVCHCAGYLVQVGRTAPILLGNPYIHVEELVGGGQEGSQAHSASINLVVGFRARGGVPLGGSMPV